MERSQNEEHTRWSPTLYKFVLVGAVLTAFFLPVVLVALPWVEFFNDMAAQPKAKSQMTYGRVHGEAILTGRSPVPGTVPRGETVTYPFEELDAVSALAAQKIKKADLADHQLKNAKLVGTSMYPPSAPTVAAMKAGEIDYDIFCAPCHGKLAQGDGPVTGAKRFPAPPSLHTDKARGYADGTIYHIITRGLGKMPSYADKLDPAQRWFVVQYVRAMQRAMKPKAKDLKP